MKNVTIDPYATAEHPYSLGMPEAVLLFRPIGEDSPYANIPGTTNGREAFVKVYGAGFFEAAQEIVEAVNAVEVMREQFRIMLECVEELEGTTFLADAPQAVQDFAQFVHEAKRDPNWSQKILGEHPAHTGHEFGGGYARAAALAAGDPDWQNAKGGRPTTDRDRHRTQGYKTRQED